MTKTTTLISLLSIAVLSGCGAKRARHPTYVQASTPFTAPAWSQSPGTAEIFGQGFLRTRGGEVRTCAGNHVLLVPATPHTADLFRLRRDGAFVHIPQELLSFVRTDICNAQGDFEFHGLPAGRWFVETSVGWFIGGPPQASFQGGVLVGMVETMDNGRVKLMLVAEHELPWACPTTFTEKRDGTKGRCRNKLMVAPLFGSPLAP